MIHLYILIEFITVSVRLAFGIVLQIQTYLCVYKTDYNQHVAYCEGGVGSQTVVASSVYEERRNNTQKQDIISRSRLKKIVLQYHNK